MRAKHVTSELEYRDPFGAVPLGDAVTLSVDVWDEQSPSAQLRIWEDSKGEVLLDMTAEEVGDHLRFSVTFEPTQTEILWYSFNITADDGAVWRYGATPACSTGEGAFAYGDPPSFQITVYQPREVQPDWYKQGIVYQIFPDRFFRGKDWERRVRDALEPKRNGPGRDLVAEWDTPVTYHKDEFGRISVWDFYGGTLEGVREKLPYLKGMGVSVIYLNPIFEAASNHRYDTADYMRIDPMLGDEESFKLLCASAAELGIRIILDGVFNHTGCDSRYFNRYGNYPEKGAYQSDDSPYSSWYKFSSEDRDEYQCWWGVDDLPDVDENDPAYREFICGEDGVVRKWLRLGASGWRLDVADELPDDFIAAIKEAALAEKPDALLIGEVWEDTSHKVSYGQLRKYLQGKELDGTMNYPFRVATLGFLTEKSTAQDYANAMEALYENYPKDAFYSCLNLLGSHDRERVLTMLAGAPDKSTLSDDQRRSYRLNNNQRGLAVSRLWVAALLQMTMPGVPCIYYGDEAGMEGYTDPYNRGPYPWGEEDLNCRAIYRNAVAVRKSLPDLFAKGDFRPFALNEDVFGFTRSYGDDVVTVLANRSLSTSQNLDLPMLGEDVDDIVQGVKPEVKDGKAHVFLWPLGTSVLYFHKEQRLQKPMERGMGVLCHITSVPNGGKPGTLGRPCEDFVDYLAECGQTYWQVLPVNPTDQFGSPYAGLSAFAGNPYLIDGFAEKRDLAGGDLAASAGYREFCDQNAEWLVPYATFQAIKKVVGEDVPWQKWPQQYADYTPDLHNLPELRDEFQLSCVTQYEFQLQWDETRAYANERGIKIIGDMPMYVSADSADVWAERAVFNLNDEGYPAGLAGTPPDDFAKDGQLWGNPTYRWKYLKSTGYGWWIRRLRRMMSLYDYVRIDHFLGFSSYYSVPEGHSAADGAWQFGPGMDFFNVAHQKLGDLPFIGEDLGTITPAVRFLVASTGFPGMDVVLFHNGDPMQGYEPAPGKICYTSTHDTQTLLGWTKARYGEHDADVTYFKLMEKCIGSAAAVVMVPLQDVLALDDSARMNVPGVASNNWSWRADAAAVQESKAYLAKLAAGGAR